MASIGSSNLPHKENFSVCWNILGLSLCFDNNWRAFGSCSERQTDMCSAECSCTTKYGRNILQITEYITVRLCRSEIPPNLIAHIIANLCILWLLRRRQISSIPSTSVLHSSVATLATYLQFPEPSEDRNLSSRLHGDSAAMPGTASVHILKKVNIEICIIYSNKEDGKCAAAQELEHRNKEGWMSSK